MELQRKKDPGTGAFVSKKPEDYRGLVQVGQMFGAWCVVSDEVRLVAGKNGKNRYPHILVQDSHSGPAWRGYANLKRGLSTRSAHYPKTGIRGYGRLRGRWEQIMARCLDPQNKAYKFYGGRGITVAEEFRICRTFCTYVAALGGVGDRKHLDRIDNERGYERGNLRWVTAKENSRNTRSNRFVVFKGERMVVTDFLRNHTEISPVRARKLLLAGVSPEEVAATKRKCLRPDRRRGFVKVSSDQRDDSPQLPRDRVFDGAGVSRG